jgi:hypothetical protein
MKRVIVEGNLFECDVTMSDSKSINFCRMIRRHYKKQVDRDTKFKHHSKTYQDFKLNQNNMKVTIQTI